MRIGPWPPCLELGGPSRIAEVSDALYVFTQLDPRHYWDTSLKKAVAVLKAAGDVR